MAKKRRKKALSGKITVSRCALNKVISLGAGHHAAIAQLKRTVKTVCRKKKTTKKRAKKRSRRR